MRVGENDDLLFTVCAKSLTSIYYYNVINFSAKKGQFYCNCFRIKFMKIKI